MRLFRWVRRFRRRCGYGVHSPYAFSFITDVIYNPGVYYAYAPLSCLCSPRLRRKDLRLLFRLVDFSRARQAAVLAAADEALYAYLKAGRSSARWEFVALDGVLPAVPGAGFVYADVSCAGWAAWVSACMDRAGEGAVIVVRGIHDSRQSCDAWRWLCARQTGGVALDLYDFGIFCLERRLYRQDYVVNYF